MIHRRPGAVIVLLTICAALPWAGGCAGGTGSATPLPPPDAAALRTRALDLLLRAATTGAAETRCNAMEALARVAPRAGAEAIRQNLRHDAAIVRYAACVAIGDARITAALDDVLRLLRDREPRVVLGAAFAAYRCGEARQAEVLVKTLAQGTDEGLRADAALLIGRLGEKSAVRRLRFTVSTDRSTRVIITAYGALAALGESDAVDRLIEYAQGAAETRVLALLALADNPAERARDTLLYRMRQRGEYIQARLLAARALGRLGSKEGLNLAMQAATQTGRDEIETYYIRSLAAHALGAIGDPRALGTLRNLAAIPDDGVQVAACYAILLIAPQPGN
ncbi:MAG: HEAT repeat domain-containing protein [Phycisphaerales bacterium]|nr:HEAT repeat domain-containing protein [Phycisphaerales bacterium]